MIQLINLRAVIKAGSFSPIQVKAINTLQPLVFDANVYLVYGSYIYGERCYEKIAKVFKSLNIPFERSQS